MGGNLLAMKPMTTDFDKKDLRPYFLWDEDLSVAEFSVRLHGSDPAERLRLLTKLLREARDIDVWHFVTLREVVGAFPTIAPGLGRRQPFWKFLLDGWREDGIIAE